VARQKRGAIALTFKREASLIHGTDSVTTMRTMQGAVLLRPMVQPVWQADRLASAPSLAVVRSQSPDSWSIPARRATARGKRRRRRQAPQRKMRSQGVRKMWASGVRRQNGVLIPHRNTDSLAKFAYAGSSGLVSGELDLCG
jgi:hypothetical protein